MACFVMFFVASLSLGYQTLSRYDPRLDLEPINDADSYYSMIQSDYSKALRPFDFGYLRPRWPVGSTNASSAGIGHWDSVYLSWLLVNSFVMALACLAIMHLGQRVGQSLTAGCIGAFFYLSSWSVANLTLGGGYVDSPEILVLLALMSAVMASAWQFTPLLLAAAAVAKETTVAFGLALMLGVIIHASLSRRKVPRAWLGWWLLSLIVGFATLYVVHARVGGSRDTTQSFSREHWAVMLSSFQAMLHHSLLIAMGPLAAFGVFRLHRLPRPMLAASLAMGVAAVLASAYAAIGTNLGRILCNTVGPVLALSGGIFICDLLRDRPARRETNPGNPP